ncbi:uncharacterized protein [Periplaneta americana]|uniref:uncharacterized protein isoform X1 n=1 Tax=Periplaneta americana TaxID=6978 RepID=UPI0037E8D3D5
MTQERRINEDTFPKWLNESLIKTVLKLEDDPTTLVTSFEITWATEVGDNYASDMYRVTVQTERMGAVEKRSFIVKVELKTGQMAKIDTMNEKIPSGSTTPKWLNNSLLETILRSEDGESTVTIISYEISRATAAGDNYTSDIYRIVVQLRRRGQLETKYLIVKASLEKEVMSEVMSKVKAFQRESEALKSTLPSMYKLLNEKSPGQFQPFSAKYLYNNDDDDSSSIIILDDLKKQGFRMAERTCGLDLQHCILVMRTIARFHAASAVLHHKDPELFNTFDKSVFREDFREDIENFFAKNVRNVATEVEKWPDYGNRYATKLHNLADESVDLITESCKRKDDDFNVLIHGDLWLNNMMFRYSEGTTEEPVDMRFVDLQLCHFTSPAQDLQYFLHTSPRLELLDQHDHLVEEYHRILGETFILLGYEHLHPSLENLHKQMEKKGRYAVITACTVLSVVLADRQNIPDMEKIMKNGDTIYYSELYKEALMKLLPLFEEKGWL